MSLGTGSNRFGLCTALMFVSAAAFSAPLNLNSKIKVLPGLLSYTDYSGAGYFNGAVDMDISASSRLDENSYLNLGIISGSENLFSLARKNTFQMKFTQNMLKIIEKDVEYSVEYKKTDFSDSVNGLRNFGEGAFNLNAVYRPFENVSGRIGFGVFDKSVNFKPDSYKYNNFSIGSSFWLNNKKDDFDIVYARNKKDSAEDNRDFKNSRTALNCKHLYDNFDFIWAGVEASGYDYNDTAEFCSYADLKLKCGYQDYLTAGVRDISVRFNGRGYSSQPKSDFNELMFEHKINYNETETAGEVVSAHRLTDFDAGADTSGSDYLQWEWDFSKFSKSAGPKGFYVSNDFTSRFWSNSSGSALKENFFEDVIGSGLRWRSYKAGSFTLGPVLGWRVYNNPASKSNSVDGDSSMLQNPNNYYMYGFTASGSCCSVENIELILNLDYKSFRDYNSKSYASKNELFGLYLNLKYKINENTVIVSSIENRMNVDEFSGHTNGAQLMNCLFYLEYTFNTIFTGAGI